DSVQDTTGHHTSRLKLFPGKLKSRWSGPFKVKEVRPYGAIVLWSTDGRDFTVNGQRIKLYMATAPEEDFNSTVWPYPGLIQKEAKSS
uniref:Uncharacterized protein n=1 Tax=Brassica oleracea var. oleracea TaxID=109376 RepID=A0A0D2ZZM2_BRAOL